MEILYFKACGKEFRRCIHLCEQCTSLAPRPMTELSVDLPTSPPPCDLLHYELMTKSSLCTCEFLNLELNHSWKLATIHSTDGKSLVKNERLNLQNRQNWELFIKGYTWVLIGNYTILFYTLFILKNKQLWRIQGKFRNTNSSFGLQGKTAWIRLISSQTWEVKGQVFLKSTCSTCNDDTWVWHLQ